MSLFWQNAFFLYLNPPTYLKNVLISKKNYVLFSRYSSFWIFIHSMVCQKCDVMMSISTWDKVHFWIYFLNHNSSSYQTWPVDRYNQGQQFPKSFEQFGGLGTKFQILFNLATCSNYSITNYVMIPMFHLFEKVNKGHSKMLNVSC